MCGFLSNQTWSSSSLRCIEEGFGFATIEFEEPGDVLDAEAEQAEDYHVIIAGRAPHGVHLTHDAWWG